MLNGNNFRAKRPLRKLSPKLYRPFKIIEARGQRAFKLKYSLH